MNCPICQGSLNTVDYEGVRIESCLSCGGEWLDGDELGKIVRLREQRFEADVTQAVEAAVPIEGVPAQAYNRELVCPKCGGLTQPLNYGGDSGIIIDRCAGCGGFWLDANELEQIQALVESWDDRLPEVMQAMSPELQRVAEENQISGRTQVSNLPVVGRFVNALVNGMFRLSR